MTTIQDRRLIVKVGLPAGLAQTWTDLHMEVETESVNGSTPNKCRVKIWNLSPTSLTFLRQKKLILQVLAGSPIPSSIFAGDIDKRGVKTTIQGPDQITEISAKDGGEIIRNKIFTASYPPGTTRSQVLTDLLAQANLIRGYIDPLIAERVYKGPVAWAAPVRNVLHELYAPEGALWSIQDGVLQVLHIGSPLPGSALLVTSGTGLMGSPTVTDKGIDLKMVLNPAIKPGGLLSVQSRVATGAYTVSKIQHRAHRTGLVWESLIQARPQ